MKNIGDNIIGIVLVHYNHYENIIKMVNTFLKLNYPNVKIVIVDNGSKNDQFRILYETFKENEIIRIIKNNRNYGYGVGNNVGIEYLRKLAIKYVLISNPDILIDDKDIFKKLIKSFDRRNIAIVAPRISHLDNSETNPGIFRRPHERSIKLSKLKYLFPIISESYFIYLYLRTFMRHNLKKYFDYPRRNKIRNNKFLTGQKTEVYSVIGCFFMINLDFFIDNKIYPVFDENIFLYNEELALAEKIYQNKGKEIVLKNCKIVHLGHSGPKLAWGKNYYLKILKHSFKSYKYILRNYF